MVTVEITSQRSDKVRAEVCLSKGGAQLAWVAQVWGGTKVFIS